ncbi:MAG: DUF3084 domain-containing protein [Armatimonadota bacterium]|nr:MAG: DUF3084 domain-containing protein [Armatimonadota bacterium]
MARFYGILLITALVIVSGVIAYVGDIVGRRMGRKRLSVFGLRPRHTAIVISVAAGMLITLLTLGVAISVSEDVKDGFLRVAEMRDEQQALSQQLAGLDGALKEREQELQRVRQAAEAQLMALKAAEVELEETKTELEETRTALQQEQEKLARASAEVRKREAVVERQTRRLTSLGRKHDKLLRDIDTLEAWKVWLTRGLVFERGQPIIFGAGQPLAAEAIDGKAPLARIRKSLDAFVVRLDKMVKAAGALPIAGDERAVVLGKPVAEPGGDALTWASPEQVLDAVTDGIRESTGDVIVRAFSVMNTHKGEPVPVDFELFHNDLVFRRGELLAETVVDGRLSPPALMELLVSLLRDEIGAKARAANVMPRQTPGAPRVFGAPREPVGEMSFEELFAVIKRLQQIDGPARVAAVAAADVWTIGPLEADLLVEPITPASAP